jgi:hypothetical protein
MIKAMPYILKKEPLAKLVFVGGKSLSNKIIKRKRYYRKKCEKTYP